jgi:hypothetical protein
MDSLIGLKGKDFVIIATDTFNAYSVLKMKVNIVAINLRPMTIKFGILMDKNYSPSEANILMFSSSETIFKKILHFFSTKMASDYPLMTRPIISDINLPRPSGKVPTALTVS